MAPSGWLKGTVKSVTSGDTLIIMGVARGAAPPEKQITLSSLKAPRLVRTPHERGERTNEHTVIRRRSPNREGPYVWRRDDGMAPAKTSLLHGNRKSFCERKRLDRSINHDDMTTAIPLPL